MYPGFICNDHNRFWLLILNCVYPQDFVTLCSTWPGLLPLWSTRWQIHTRWPHRVKWQTAGINHWGGFIIYRINILISRLYVILDVPQLNSNFMFYPFVLSNFIPSRFNGWVLWWPVPSLHVCPLVCSFTCPSACLPFTHWGRDKMAAISQTTFSNTFLEWKYMNFAYDFTEVCT